ncbi:transcription factor [Kwoniella heveanensis CBS 569]|nr:transcription factor [Kwoniella heveanensis CBS 569]
MAFLYRCVRPSRGQDMSEVCERCTEDHVESECITKKRRVGRQVGVKNRKSKAAKLLEQHLLAANRDGGHVSGNGLVGRNVDVDADGDHLPNPLHMLASEAVRRQPTPESESPILNSDRPSVTRTRIAQNSQAILERYEEWTRKVHPVQGAKVVSDRLNALLSPHRDGSMSLVDEPAVFSGRVDMSRPDASPEHDVISLQMLTLPEANHLFRSFMDLITNGSIYFDPRLHTLAYIRERSSFLLAVILAIASTYKSICPSALLHAQLMNHATRLEMNVRNNHYKSIEIVQALLLLASWSEVPHTLCRDRTWLYVSHATALAVELRLDTPLPYCIQTDPLYDHANHEILVRNAHRACMYLYIHDRNMAMVAGRYPIFPESNISSTASLDKWGKQPSRYRYDAALCASVSLRKLVIEVHHKLATRRLSDFKADKEVIDQTLSNWRKKWSNETQRTLEYDIIARFSTFVLHLTLLRKGQYEDKMELEARQACEELAFEVCCTSINHYKSWKGLLNSATFDTSMVAFCAIYTIQTINHSSSTLQSSPPSSSSTGTHDQPHSQPQSQAQSAVNHKHVHNPSDPPTLSEWSLFRLSVLQELVAELESQSAARHRVDHFSGGEGGGAGMAFSSMNVVDAMARQLSRGIKLVLNKHFPAPTPPTPTQASTLISANRPSHHGPMKNVSINDSNNQITAEGYVRSHPHSHAAVSGQRGGGGSIPSSTFTSSTHQIIDIVSDGGHSAPHTNADTFDNDLAMLSTSTANPSGNSAIQGNHAQSESGTSIGDQSYSHSHSHHQHQNHLHQHVPQHQQQQQQQQQQQHQYQFDELNQLIFANNAIPFIPDWNLESLLPPLPGSPMTNDTLNFPWETNPSSHDSSTQTAQHDGMWGRVDNVPMFDFSE